jgi:hypothetical protein
MPESPEQISNEIQDLLQQSILNSFPNPDRRGCLGEQTVREVAGRPLPVQDAAWEHITHCSPCFREFLGFRRELTDARKRLVRRNRIVLVSALAAAGIAGVAIWTGALHGTRTPTTIAAVVRVDLRPFAPMRSEVQNPPQGTQVAATLSRQAVRLEISLPVGSDEGKYDVRLMDGELHSLMSSSTATAFTDHVVSISVAFDLSRLAPGAYVLGVHGPDGNWRAYPVAIR